MRGPWRWMAVAALAAGCGTGIRRAPLLEATTGSLARTRVAAHPSVAVPEGECALWCATAQLCWDAMPLEGLSGPIELGPPAPPELVAAMEATPFPEDALDPACHVAMGGFRRDGIDEAIRAAMRRKFGEGARQPEFEPRDHPLAFLAYAYLLKDLPFETPFETRPEPMPFHGGAKRVAWFGILPGTGHVAAARLRRQVTVRSVRRTEEGEWEFVVELRPRGTPRGERDRILLAALAPGGSLRETWESVRDRMEADEAEPLPPGSVLLVPKMNFRVDHEFEEFRDAPFRNPELEGGCVESFRQWIRFELSESGARLESEAVAMGVESAMPRITSFVFDRPFLLALIQEGADTPYFLFWVGNDELLAEVP